MFNQKKFKNLIIVNENAKKVLTVRPESEQTSFKLFMKGKDKEKSGQKFKDLTKMNQFLENEGKGIRDMPNSSCVDDEDKGDDYSVMAESCIEVSNVVAENIGLNLQNLEFEKIDLSCPGWSYEPACLSDDKLKQIEEGGMEENYIVLRKENLQIEEDMTDLFKSSDLNDTNIPNFGGKKGTEKVIKKILKIYGDKNNEAVLLREKLGGFTKFEKKEIKGDFETMKKKFEFEAKKKFSENNEIEFEENEESIDERILNKNREGVKIILRKNKIVNQIYSNHCSYHYLIVPTKNHEKEILKSKKMTSDEKLFRELIFSLSKKQEIENFYLNSEKPGNQNYITHPFLKKKFATKFSLKKVINKATKGKELKKVLYFASKDLNYIFNIEKKGIIWLRFDIQKKICKTKKLMVPSNDMLLYNVVMIDRFCPLTEKKELFIFFAFYYPLGLFYDESLGKYQPIKTLEQKEELEKNSGKEIKNTAVHLIDNTEGKKIDNIFLGNIYFQKNQRKIETRKRKIFQKRLRASPNLVAFQKSENEIEICLNLSHISNEKFCRNILNEEMRFNIKMKDIFQWSEGKNIRKIDKEEEFEKIKDFFCMSKTEFIKTNKTVKESMRAYILILTNSQLIIIDVGNYITSPLKSWSKKNSISIFDIVDLKSKNQNSTNSKKKRRKYYESEKIFSNFTQEKEFAQFDVQIISSLKNSGYYLTSLRFSGIEFESIKLEKDYHFNPEINDPMKAFEAIEPKSTLFEELIDEGKAKSGEKFNGFKVIEDNKLPLGTSEDEISSSYIVPQPCVLKLTHVQNFKISPENVFNTKLDSYQENSPPPLESFSIRPYTLTNFKFNFNPRRKVYRLMFLIEYPEEDKIINNEVHCDQNLVYCEFPEFHSGDLGFKRFKIKKEFKKRRNKRYQEIEELDQIQTSLAEKGIILSKHHDFQSMKKNLSYDDDKLRSMEPVLKSNLIHFSSEARINRKSSPLAGIFLKNIDDESGHTPLGFFSYDFDLVYLDTEKIFQEQPDFFLPRNSKGNC